jgi:HAD superfamily hydrolase (TIGR01458 family)
MIARMAIDAEGVLLDIDGVLTMSSEPIPGAADTLQWLRKRQIPFLLVTNTSSQSRKQIASSLAGAGMPVGSGDIMTAVTATGAYLRSHHLAGKVMLLSDEQSIEDLEGVEVRSEGADIVVIGGASDLFTYANLNRAFQLVMAGAPLVAMHRSLYWKSSQGLELDGGAYTRALEEAAGVEAVVCGKPAPEFFNAAADAVGHPIQNLAMVGDDVVTDVGGAQSLGAIGVLVRSGKFREQDLKRASPDHVIDSIAHLPHLLAP